MEALKLYVGNKFTGITVEPDKKYPGVMWRVRQGEYLSEMVNLARAKDAALSWAARDRGYGIGPRDGIKWARETKRRLSAA